MVHPFYRYIAIAALCTASFKPALVHAAHPLITEDTGTQGKGKFQLEHNNEWGYKEAGATRETARTTSTSLSYGFTDNADVVATIPYLRSKTSELGSIESESGRSDNGIDVKWRFHENAGWSYALKLGVTAPTGDETKGLGNGRATYSSYLVATLEKSTWAANWHVGRIANRNKVGDRDEIWHASAGGWLKIADKFNLVTDAGVVTNPDVTAPRELGWATLGIVYSPTEDFDLDTGIKAGLTQEEVDYALLLGFTYRF